MELDKMHYIIKTHEAASLSVGRSEMFTNYKHSLKGWVVFLRWISKKEIIWAL